MILIQFDTLVPLLLQGEMQRETEITFFYKVVSMGSHLAILEQNPDGRVGGKEFERKSDTRRNAEVRNSGGRLTNGGIDVAGGVSRPDAQPQLLRVI